jgi:hypothetical protein
MQIFDWKAVKIGDKVACEMDARDEPTREIVVVLNQEHTDSVFGVTEMEELGLVLVWGMKMNNGTAAFGRNCGRVADLVEALDGYKNFLSAT